MEHRRLNWRYMSAPQSKLRGRRIYIPRGKVLGGTSSINGMVYMRGHRGDYDDWARAGNPGWSYRDVLPYFRKSENNVTFGATRFHGADGPMNVQDCERYSPLVGMMCDAAAGLGFPRTDDFNGALQEGFGQRQVNHRAGRRESSATAFLAPVRHRRNLAIVTDALVDRVPFDARRAIGVEAIIGGARRRYTARREVIIACGTIASPLLLMRSGIGPAAELSRHGIAVIHDLSGVGRNLQDHATVPIRHSSPSTIPYGLSWRTIPFWARSVVEYALFRRGILSNTLMHAGGFVRTDPALDRPDVQFILMPLNRTPTGRTGIGHGYGLLTVLLRPESRGAITLTSAAPDAAPCVDLGLLAHDADLDGLLRGLALGRRILASPAWDAVRGPEIAPGPRAQSNAAMENYIRGAAATAFHTVGTCRMGAGADAVVDAALRVHGVEGLRVADASIMPTIIGGNTHAPVVMIAEKAVDMILGRAALPPAASQDDDHA